jgi:putative tributyrin esterase
MIHILNNSIIKFCIFFLLVIILNSCRCTITQQQDTHISLPRGMSTISIPDRIIEKAEPEKKDSPDSDETVSIRKEADSKTEKDGKSETAEETKTGKTSNIKNEETVENEEDEFDNKDASPEKTEKKEEKIESASMIPVDIYLPRSKTITGDILVLPGWRFSRKRWHKETDLLKFADKYGFRAIFPEMGVTNYESKYFKETTMKWAATPGGKWIKEIMIPQLQKKYGLLLPKSRNYLLGLSTGGRGVLLVSLQNPDLFTAGATLSGDCNQAKMPNDRLMTSTYGPYRNFSYRWKTVDNPEISAMKGKWKMPLYIGHGRKDRISPFSQSKSLFITLKKRYPKLKVVLNAPKEAGHDFKYWNSEIEPVFRFFVETE